MHIDQSYSDSLLQGLNSLRQTGSLCDVELISGTTTLFAHRVVLSAISDYFKAMFTGDMGESLTKSVHIKDVDEKSLCCLLEFAYTGNININVFNVQSLLITANMLQMQKVVTACCDFLECQLNAANCIGFMEFADAYSLTNLKTKCEYFIAENFPELTNYDEYLHLEPNMLKQILAMNDLNITNEEIAFTFLEQWILYDREKRINYFIRLFEEIRSSSFSFKFLLFLKHHSFLKLPSSYPIQLELNSQISMKVNPYRILNEELSFARSPRRNSKDLILIGGKESLTNSLYTCTIYNSHKNKWNQSTSLSSPQHYGAAVSINGTVYLVGGTIESSCSSLLTALKPHSLSWIQLAQMNEQRCSHSVVKHDGLIYVLGGYNGTQCLRSMECYDPKTNTWTALPSMSYNRCSLSAVVVEDTIYALGGQGRGHLCSVEKYDIKQRKWDMAPGLSCKRINFGAAQIHGYIFVMGGHDGKEYLSSVERYDPVTSEWAVVSSMPSARTGIGVAVLNNRIFVLGGHDGNRYLNSTLVYNPMSDKWASIADMNTPRCYMACTDVWL